MSNWCKLFNVFYLIKHESNSTGMQEFVALIFFLNTRLRKVCQNTSFFWPVFSRVMIKLQFCSYKRKYGSDKTRILACFMQCTDEPPTLVRFIYNWKPTVTIVKECRHNAMKNHFWNVTGARDNLVAFPSLSPSLTYQWYCTSYTEKRKHGCFYAMFD